MAGKGYVQCAGPSYHLQDRKAAIQSAINCYPKRLEGDNVMMQSTPGEVLIATLPGEVRNSRNVEGRWFVVAGNTLYEMTAVGAYTVRGTLSSSAGFVGMADNMTQLAFVDGANLYIFTLASNVLTAKQ